MKNIEKNYTTLIIDTTSPRLYCILLKDGEVAGSQTVVGIQHSCCLNQSIDKLLSDCGIGLSDIQCFATNIGTGSFTGIRISIATVKGFLTAYPDKLFVPFTTLNVLAYTKQGEVDCLMDAGRQLFYYAKYDKIKVIEEDCLISSLLAEQKLQQGAVVWSEQTDYTEQICQLVKDKQKAQMFSKQLSPLYLRQPQAMEQLHDKKNT